MGRPFGVAKVEWRVRISKDLAGRIEHILSDPRYNKVAYGIKSSMVERLLREWVQGVQDGLIKLPDVSELEEKPMENPDVEDYS
jgi:hypothetical protein